jgi:hypothetical protein
MKQCPKALRKIVEQRLVYGRYLPGILHCGSHAVDRRLMDATERRSVEYVCAEETHLGR